jgi:HAD superfamily hydrolase (TIGR01509 family)
MEEGALRQDLYLSLGYDPRQRRTIPGSPLSIAGTHKLQTLAAGALYRHGVPWPQAEDRAQEVFAPAAQPPLVELVRPAGDVAGLLARLHAAGVRVAVVTTDHRAETLEALHLLGITELVDQIVCGDDGLVSKPAPDMLLAACRRTGVEPEHTAVVGDTAADLLMGRRAGAGLVAAVLTGPADAVELRTRADVVLSSIDEIQTGN